MKTTHFTTGAVYALLGLSVLNLAGCVVRERGPDYDRHRTNVVVEDPHRGWWDSHHHGEAYDRERAAESHRSWCGEHGGDSSCGSWYHH